MLSWRTLLFTTSLIMAGCASQPVTTGAGPYQLTIASSDVRFPGDRSMLHVSNELPILLICDGPLQTDGLDD